MVAYTTQLHETHLLGCCRVREPQAGGSTGVDVSRGWLVQVVYVIGLHLVDGCICDTIAWWWQTHSCWVCAMAVGGSVVYATQLRGSGRLIVVGCVQWQLVDRLYMRHNCVVVADSSLLGVCNGSFGTIRLAGLHGWAGLGGSFGASSPRLRPAQRNY